MATTPTQIRIDSVVKKQAATLFADLGMDISSAVNIFLRQCILHGGLPFSIELPRYRQETDEFVVSKEISAFEKRRNSLKKIISSKDH